MKQLHTNKFIRRVSKVDTSKFWLKLAINK